MNASDSKRSGSVLLAHEDADRREYLLRILSGNFEVIAVADGVSAFSAAERHRPHLVLSTPNLACADGVPLPRRLREDPRTEATPLLLLLSGPAEEEMIKQAETLADDYLQEPFSEQELLNRIRWRVNSPSSRDSAGVGPSRPIEDVVEEPVQKRTTRLLEANRELREELARHKQTEEALRSSERRWYTLFSQAAVGISEISLEGVFLRANDEWCRIVGRTRAQLMTMSFAQVTQCDYREKAMEAFRKCVAQGEAVSWDNYYAKGNGSMIWANTVLTRLEDEEHRPQAILAVAVDLTARQLAEQKLHRSEAEFRAFFELAAAGIAQVDAVTRKFLRVNQRFTEMVQYSERELRKMTFLDLTNPEEVAISEATFDLAVRGGEDEFSLEKRLRRRDGSVIWVTVTASVVRDHRNEALCTMAIVQDISRRKEAEEALRRASEELEQRVRERTNELDQVNRALRLEIWERLRIEEARQEVLRQLVSAQEEERRRLSRELHDGIGQHLTALMLGLKSLDESSVPATRVTLKKLQTLTETVGREIHDMALELRPTALDDLGLLRTLSNYVDEWSGKAGVPVDFHSTGLDEKRLRPPVETTIFRVVKEALHNVLKHAGAKRVSLILERRDDQAVVIIEDDGKGFDYESIQRTTSRRRLGLLGMEERVALVNGELKIESSTGCGTTVFVRIPLSSQLEI